MISLHNLGETVQDFRKPRLVPKLMSALQLSRLCARVPIEDDRLKGMMYSDVPNLASAFGYTNASWTLKCDLTSEYVCRLLKNPLGVRPAIVRFSISP